LLFAERCVSIEVSKRCGKKIEKVFKGRLQDAAENGFALTTSSERSFRRVNKSEPIGSDGGARGEAAGAE
jgi:hypothetical protein